MSNGTTHRIALSIALAAALALGASGCSKRTDDVKLVSAWPVANSERTVPKPPVPPKWPLTGKRAPSEAVTKRRVVSVKVENSSLARPQTGLNSADVVYESVTEGGITRFNALFQSKDAPIVGPVRSARLSDLWIVPQYDALFFYSGATSTINGRVNGAGIANLSQDKGIARPYFRSSERRTPHNLYLRENQARGEAKKQGLPVTTNPPRTLAHAASVDATEPVREITVPLSDIQTTTWVYQPSRKVYLRSDNGNRSIDAATGKQVQSSNVVVMWARYKPFSRDKVGSTTYAIVLGGTGQATIFRNGVKVDGVWEAGEDAPPAFKTKDGQRIKLAPGNTWFEVIDTKVNIRMK